MGNRKIDLITKDDQHMYTMNFKTIKQCKVNIQLMGYEF